MYPIMFFQIVFAKIKLHVFAHSKLLIFQLLLLIKFQNIFRIFFNDLNCLSSERQLTIFTNSVVSVHDRDRKVCEIQKLFAIVALTTTKGFLQRNFSFSICLFVRLFSFLVSLSSFSIFYIAFSKLF